VRSGLAALAVLFLLAHLISLPPTLEDIDSVNFALGVRDFDVAKHQPHPPGYPVFIALAKVSTAVMERVGPAHAAPTALGLLSAIAGAASIPLLFLLFRQLADDDIVAWWGMAIAVCSPLFWFTALRPLSDMTGLAFAVASQWLVLSAWRDRESRPGLKTRPYDEAAGSQRLLAGAVLCGLAAGVRVQTLMLTAPLLVAVLAWPGTRLSFKDRGLAVGAAVLGALVWAVPLLAANGGVGGYLAALGTQAGEDFSGVVMLWTTRQARVAVDAVLNSVVWPWKEFWTGTVVVIVAIVGMARLAWRMPTRFVLLIVAFGPYEIFHLLFHETATMRYALPIVLPVAFLVAYAAAGLGRIATAATAISLIGVSLVQTLPAARAYAQTGSPAFRAFEALALIPPRHPPDPVLAGTPGGSYVLSMHAALRRVEEWEHDRHPWRVIRAQHGHEWLALVEHWRADPTPVIFTADPRRTDLALFDPQARTRDVGERWAFPVVPFVAGVRPGAADGYYMRPPGWMLDRGWALTAEVGGITERDGAGPHRQPSVAWIRGRSGAADLIIGGRHLGSAGDPAARVTLASDRGPIDSWQIQSGFFFRRIAVPAGVLDGSGYVPLRVSSAAADGSARVVPVSLEQFDVQPEGTVMFGFVDGWHEPEYNPRTAQAWRWMSEQARLWIRPIGRDVVLTITGESPLRYFDKPPSVRVSAAGTSLAQFSPPADFTQRITIPGKALSASGGIVTIDTDLWFSPADRGESPDKRHLGLRAYRVSVE
jgi:Protein of unknown function (DUF2723)